MLVRRTYRTLRETFLSDTISDATFDCIPGLLLDTNEVEHFLFQGWNPWDCSLWSCTHQ
jgi:hypothetical protein